MGFEELQSQKVANYWKSGEDELISWLSSNIKGGPRSELEEILDADLEIIDAVGVENLDLLVRNTETGQIILIADHVTSTDRDLLRSFSRAAQANTDVVVWIASEFTERHLDAIQWLSDRSSAIDFYNIQMEIWKIGDSDPAIRLKQIDLDSKTVAQYRGAPVQRSTLQSIRNRLFSINRRFWQSIKQDDGRL